MHNLYYLWDILDTIDLENGKELIKYRNSNNLINLNLNISTGIASAITSYSRIYMSQFKNNDDYNLYYTDTDSIFIDKPLNDNFTGNDLGQMKLENIFKKCVFIAPKLYGGIIDNGKEIAKVKGYRYPIKIEELEKVLKKDFKLEYNQDKWYRNFTEGKITIKNQIYTIMITNNKRQIIFDENNIFTDTKPLYVNNNNDII